MLIIEGIASYFHIYPIVGFRPIVLDREFLSDIWRVFSQGSIHLLLHYTIQSFPIGTRALGTITSSDFSRQALLRHGTSNDSSSPMQPWDLLG